jgi:hypothetical protein
MFVTNKRVKLPKEIVEGSKAINDKCEEIKVSVVNSFKLLGVTIDNKLTFVEHCSNLKKIVNKKLYSIKRLFFLCTSVKIHFFKTFILRLLSLTHYLFPIFSLSKSSIALIFVYINSLNFDPKLIVTKKRMRRK